MVDEDSVSERASCPWCGEEISTVAIVCRHCRNAPLWDVRIDEALEARVTYRAARALETSSIVGFREARSAMDAAPGLILTGLVQDDACRALEVLAQHDVSAEMVAHVGRVAASRRPWSLVNGLRRQPALVFVAVVVAFIGLVVVVGRKDEPVVAEADLSAVEISRKVERATVHLQCSDHLGSGFFVEPNLVLTNAHVVCSGGEISVTTADGLTRIGRLVQRNDFHDLALIRVPGAAAVPLPLGDVTGLTRGDRVFAMGSPFGLDFTLSQGIVSHPDRVFMGVSYVQMGADIHPGNSGGALVDSAGRAVGVVSMQVTGNPDLGFAVPVNYLERFPGFLDKHGPWFDASAWSIRLDSARKSELNELENARAELDKPMLAGVTVFPPNELVAIVVWAGETAPSSEHLDFTVRLDGEVLCRPTGRIQGWRPRSSEGGVHHSRRMQWLEDHGIRIQFWAGSAHLRMTGCPRPALHAGATIELEGGATPAGGFQVGG